MEIVARQRGGEAAGVKHPIITLLVLAFGLLSVQQTRAATSNSEKEIIQLEEAFVAALIKADAAAVERMLADDFQFTGPDGSTQNKAGFVRDVKSGDLKLTSSVMSDTKVHFASAELVVISYRSVDKGTFKTNDISGAYRWTDVAVKRNGRWQFLVGHGTPIPEKK